MSEVQVSKWGNSAAIRLPKAVLEALGIGPGSRVNLTLKDGRAFIEPARPDVVTLEWIVSEMDRLGPENEPETVDWGPDVGSEIIDDDYSRGLIVEPDSEGG